MKNATERGKAECQSCLFWIRIYSSRGTCKRYPPKPTAIGLPGVFPEIKENDWCGEFKNKDKMNT